MPLPMARLTRRKSTKQLSISVYASFIEGYVCGAICEFICLTTPSACTNNLQAHTTVNDSIKAYAEHEGIKPQKSLTNLFYFISGIRFFLTTCSSSRDIRGLENRFK